MRYSSESIYCECEGGRREERGEIEREGQSLHVKVRVLVLVYGEGQRVSSGSIGMNIRQDLLVEGDHYGIEIITDSLFKTRVD